MVWGMRMGRQFHAGQCLQGLIADTVLILPMGTLGRSRLTFGHTVHRLT